MDPDSEVQRGVARRGTMKGERQSGASQQSHSVSVQPEAQGSRSEGQDSSSEDHGVDNEAEELQETTRPPARHFEILRDFQEMLIREEEDVDTGRNAGVFAMADIYDAVVVAAFGGVQAKVVDGLRVNVHPFYLFLLCAPLAAAQYSCLTCLCLGMPVEEPVNIIGADSKMLVSMKSLMVLILQFTSFSEILGALKLMTFLCNPTTWMDVSRLDPSKKHRWMFKTVYILPFAFTAIFLKVFIDYLVLTYSLSVILASRSVENAIFNSLAITFIADLDETMWQVSCQVFGIEMREQNGEYQFQLFSEEDRLNQCPFDKCAGKEHMLSCLRRHPARAQGDEGEAGGGGFNGIIVENCLTYGTIFVIEVRQLFIYTFALSTNILPAARDVCNTWRCLQDGRVGCLMTLEILLALDVKDEFQSVGEKLDGCPPVYDPMNIMDLFHMTWECPHIILGGTALLVGVLVIPHLLRALLKHCLQQGAFVSRAGSRSSSREPWWTRSGSQGRIRLHTPRRASTRVAETPVGPGQRQTEAVRRLEPEVCEEENYQGFSARSSPPSPDSSPASHLPSSPMSMGQPFAFIQPPNLVLQRLAPPWLGGGGTVPYVYLPLSTDDQLSASYR